MIKLREEDMSKAETDWKLGLLHLTVSQAVTAKEKFLKKMKSASPVTWKISIILMKKFEVLWDSPICDTEMKWAIFQMLLGK